MRTAIWVFLLFALSFMQKASVKWLGIDPIQPRGFRNFITLCVLVLFIVCFFICVLQDLKELSEGDKP
jgi:hypothetical protein